MFVFSLFLPLLTLYFQVTWAQFTPPYSGASVKQFYFDLTWEQYAPDGFSRPMMLVNGQSPGPVIEVDQDDWVVVYMKNSSPFNTTLHFHGIEMHGTPWSDGVPGLSQRAIKPGSNFVYQFQATQYGSHWYHSHFEGQIEDGLYGAILIHPRPNDPKPFYLISNDSKAINAMALAEKHVKPLLISDFAHVTSIQKWDMTLQAGIEDVCYDSIIFNGKGRVQCLPKDEVNSHLSPLQKTWLSGVPGAAMTDKSCVTPAVMYEISGGVTGNESAIIPGTFSGCKETNGSIEVIEAGTHDDEGSWAALDIIGAINYITGTVSIDEHDMWVYAMDGSYVKPQKVQALTLNNGDRYSVLVQSHKAGEFKIRCHAITQPQFIVGHAILRVKGPGTSTGGDSKPYIDISGSPVSPDVVVFDQAKAHPFPPEPIPQKADALFKLNMRVNKVPYWWALNSSHLMSSEIESKPLPILFQRPDLSGHDNVTISTRNNTWVDLVLFAPQPPFPPYPIHKHGGKMFWVGAGTGDFKWPSVEEAAREKPELFNLVDPPRRDTFVTLLASKEPSWVVVRYHVTNPGAWLLHCHVNNHMMEGMSVVIQDGVDAWPTVPPWYLHQGSWGISFE